jgi:hypothetical protein
VRAETREEYLNEINHAYRALKNSDTSSDEISAALEPYFDEVERRAGLSDVLGKSSYSRLQTVGKHLTNLVSESNECPFLLSMDAVGHEYFQLASIPRPRRGLGYCASHYGWHA